MPESKTRSYTDSRMPGPKPYNSTLRCGADPMPRKDCGSAVCKGDNDGHTRTTTAVNIHKLFRDRSHLSRMGRSSFEERSGRVAGPLRARRDTGEPSGFASDEKRVRRLPRT